MCVSIDCQVEQVRLMPHNQSTSFHFSMVNINPTLEETPPKQPRFRFSMKTMLIIITTYFVLLPLYPSLFSVFGFLFITVLFPASILLAMLGFVRKLV